MCQIMHFMLSFFIKSSNAHYRIESLNAHYKFQIIVNISCSIRS